MHGLGQAQPGAGAWRDQAVSIYSHISKPGPRPLFMWLQGFLQILHWARMATLGTHSALGMICLHRAWPQGCSKIVGDTQHWGCVW